MKLAQVAVEPVEAKIFGVTLGFTRRPAPICQKHQWRSRPAATSWPRWACLRAWPAVGKRPSILGSSPLSRWVRWPGSCRSTNKPGWGRTHTLRSSAGELHAFLGQSVKVGVSIRVEPVQPRSCRPRSSAKIRRTFGGDSAPTHNAKKRCNITAAYARVRGKMTLIRDPVVLCQCPVVLGEGSTIRPHIF